MRGVTGFTWRGLVVVTTSRGGRGGGGGGGGDAANDASCSVGRTGIPDCHLIQFHQLEEEHGHDVQHVFPPGPGRRGMSEEDVVAEGERGGRGWGRGK